MRIKYLSAAFIVFLIGIVIIANMGLGPIVFQFLRYIPGGDKTGHFVLMGLFSLFVNLSMRVKRVDVAGFSLLKGSLIVALIVTVEEFSQLLLKHRGFSLLDLACDYLGIIAFGVLAEHWVRARQAKQAAFS